MFSAVYYDFIHLLELFNHLLKRFELTMYLVNNEHQKNKPVSYPSRKSICKYARNRPEAKFIMHKYDSDSRQTTSCSVESGSRLSYIIAVSKRVLCVHFLCCHLVREKKSICWENKAIYWRYIYSVRAVYVIYNRHKRNENSVGMNLSSGCHNHARFGPHLIFMLV